MHRLWFLPPKTGTRAGYRRGFGAGRCTIDDYIPGSILPIQLSRTGAFQHVCRYCRALFFSSEAVRGKSSAKNPLFSLCCRHGRLKYLPVLPPAPTELAELLTGRAAADTNLSWHPFTSAGLISHDRLSGQRKQDSDHFRQNVRSYNTAMGFVSFTDTLSSADPGHKSSSSSAVAPPVYILHGRAYHIAGTLYPPEGTSAKFAQLYVLDASEAVAARVNTFDGLRSSVLRTLLNMLTTQVLHKDPWNGSVALLPLQDVRDVVAPRNPYPAHFLNMHNLISSHRATHADSLRIHALRFAGGEQKDPRTYNKPSAAEVSCTVVGEGPLPRHFVSIYERADSGSGSTHSLSYLSEHVDPLTYPLVHVYGTLGYSRALMASDADGNIASDRISMREFYAHRLMQRYAATDGMRPPWLVYLL